MSHPRYLAGALLVPALTAAPALAIERRGRVKSTDARFQKFTIAQEGDGRESVIRIGPDTVLVTLDSRVVPHPDPAPGRPPTTRPLTPISRAFTLVG
ncbi:MAG TPA: hypothetical protein VG406_12385 [Isosphaeraceae bacterium]|jgi:hypothetical protein|nr:hypothetical protein [Isosphaeraceae bacterium]